MSSIAYPRDFDQADAASRNLPMGWVIAIIAAYMLPGLVGHDPWKQDEAYVFGGILDMLKDGDWVVVKVGGVPFMEKPPLFHWVGALCAMLFTPYLPLHDAARMASGVFVGTAVAAVAVAARVLCGAGRGRIAALAMLGTLGLFSNAQLMITDLPVMTGFALALAGWAGCHRGHAWGCIVLGVGIGVGFLGKGVFAPAVLGVAAVLLPVFVPAWRTRRYWRDLTIASLAAAPFLLIWPAVLWVRAPELFGVWFWENNVGRYVGFSVPYLGAATEEGFWLETWPWFLFPMWIVVAMGLVRESVRLLRDSAMQLALVVAGCIAVVLATSASARAIYALPMIAPLALAVAAAEHARPRSDGWLFPMGIAFAAVVGAATWYCAARLALSSHAPDWPWLTRYFEPDFALVLSPVQWTGAGVLTVGFIALCVVLQRTAHRGIAAWTGALAVGWSLVALLLYPWIDHSKSYRGMYESLAASIPAGVDCVASLGLGESERAMLEYVTSIPATDPDQGCRGVLRQRRADKVEAPLPKTWRRVWTGSRPGDLRERFELWVRDPPAPNANLATSAGAPASASR